jgi:hypothetical protein
VTERWERANIIATAVTLSAAGPSGGHAPSGIRIGVQEVTRLGRGPAEMSMLADLMREAADAADPTALAGRATELVTAFPTVYYCLEQPRPYSTRPETVSRAEVLETSRAGGFHIQASHESIGQGI